MGDVIILRPHDNTKDMSTIEIEKSAMKSRIASFAKEAGAGLSPVPFANYLRKEFQPYSNPFPVITLANILGIRVYAQDIKEVELKGYLFLKGTDPVICVNSQESHGHHRFTVAHELWHYYYDHIACGSATQIFGEFEDSSESEKIANTFAAELLMPKNLFISKYIELKSFSNPSREDILSDFFGVSKTAIRRRIEDLC